MQGLEILDSANLAYLNKDQSAKLFALRGALLSRLDRPEETNRAFSAALQVPPLLPFPTWMDGDELQMQDGLSRAWGQWGEHLLKTFTRDGRMETAKSALTAFLQAARQEQEFKARKHIAKVLFH